MLPPTPAMSGFNLKSGVIPQDENSLICPPLSFLTDFTSVMLIFCSEFSFNKSINFNPSSLLINTEGNSLFSIPDINDKLLPSGVL